MRRGELVISRTNTITASNIDNLKNNKYKINKKDFPAYRPLMRS